MSPDFRIAETRSFQKLTGKNEFRKLYARIKDYIYPQLKKNPFFGPNIRKLKGELNDYYRYRIGDYRLFYQVDSNKVIVFVVYLAHRKNAYKK